MSEVKGALLEGRSVPSGAVRSSFHALIERSQDNLRAVLDPLFEGVTRCALVDFPNHVNVGDNLIWLGEKIYLRMRGIKTAYSCDLYTYDREALRKAVGRGPILIHGGGNMGDVWPKHESFRRRILADFPENRIIQMPQTVYFSSAEEAAKAKSVYDAHPDFTILVRDSVSLETARNAFKSRSLLAPDSAFFLGAVNGKERAAQDTVMLLRTDHESKSDPASPPQGSVDWKSGFSTWRSRLCWRLIHARMKHPVKLKRADLVTSALFDRMAFERYQFGRRMLGAGRTVITDRLHAHILCILMGIPHVCIDNNYGKISRYARTWAHEAPGIRWAATLDEAKREAAELMKGLTSTD